MDYLNSPARPDLSKLNNDGYKSIAQNINQTVNNVLSSSRRNSLWEKCFKWIAKWSV